MNIKQKIADSMKLLYNKNYITLRDGNVSFKPRNKDYFYISAGSVLKNTITPEQVIKVNFNDERTWFDDTKMYKPSQELNMHYFLQRKKQNYLHDTFILHAHPPNTIAYMGLNVNNIELNTIKQYFPEMNVGLIGKNVPFFNAGSEELAEACLNNLYNPYTMIGLKQHGTLSIGSDVNELIEHIETLEKYLDIYFKSTSIHVRHVH